MIYNGLPITPYPNLANPLPSADKYMLFVGRLTEEKQLEHAMHTFSSLADKHKGLHFVIVGGAGPEDEGYVQTLKDKFMSNYWLPRVHWLGHCHDVTKWYVHAQFLILTSKHEGFGRVLVEAMAQSTPVVAYAVGGVPEVFEDGNQGFLIAPNDIKAMGNACEILLDDETMRMRMGQAGAKHAQKFSIEKHVNQVVSVYQGLVNQSRG